MDAVYEELDEAKAEIEKLKEQYRVKVELSESLKRAHNDQINKNKETNTKLERLAQELNDKDDEISTAKQMYEEIKSNLTEKESIIRRISSAHDKLRFDSSEKLTKCEEENKALTLALDDANAKNLDQEQQICALKQEIEGVKRVLSFSQKKCSENEIKTKKELQGREDVFLELEDENKKFEDQLKWKKEQFVHLEEAHQKLRNEFRTKEKEWEKEKGTLLDGICSLQTKLESQIRISQDLERRLEMCNQALAHAESKRKVLEVQLSESRTSFDSVCAEYDEAKLNFDELTTKRDQEIATLRSSLGTKEILYKEMEYQFKKLEQEKQDLSVSLKELQETQIREAGFSFSSSKLQNKLKSLEQAHKGCSMNLKAKESEWLAEMEKLSEELDSCRMEIKKRDSSLNELNRELEDCDSLILKLELLNQETSLVLLVLKSEFSEAQRRIASDNDDSSMNVHKLVEQLKENKADFDKVQKDLDEEREKVVILSEKVKTLEELQFPLQKDVEKLKDMLEESKTYKVQSEEHVVQLRDALDRANEELYEKSCEANEIEFELQIWKSIAEQMELNLKRNLQLRKEVESSLFAQMEVELSLKQEKETLTHQLEEKDKRIGDLQQQLSDVENEQNSFETENFSQLVEEKDQRISDLQQLVASLEKEFESSTTSFSSKLSRMQRERNILRESWENIRSDETLKEMEIQEKNIAIEELENDLRDSEKTIENLTEKNMKLSSENENLTNTIGLISEKMDLLAMEDAKLMESLGKNSKNIAIEELENDLRNTEKTIENLTEKNMKLSSENANLANAIGIDI
ncbi:hypothetical protein DH2020_013805 [Rehmannia glutinosa]|uniref:Uncharacterized protein n=1 Tax=Rehmannia glutinosa TaxID=99300 RepID=A0ABR0X4M8_REHGL